VHGGGLALLLGALGLAGLRTGALPRPLAVAALAAAGVNGLAPLVLAAPKAALVIPAGRFPSFVILGIAGFRLAGGAELAEPLHRWFGRQRSQGRGQDLNLTARCEAF
jgi:hypothetical protein